MAAIMRGYLASVCLPLLLVLVSCYTVERVTCSATSASAGASQDVHKAESWPADRNNHINVESEELSSSGRKRRATSNKRNIRITAIYDDASVDVLPASKREVLMMLTNDAINYLQSIYSVVPLTSPISMQRDCEMGRFIPSLSSPGRRACQNNCAATTMCGDVPVPATHLQACYHCTVQSVCNTTGTPGPGVSSSDLVIYVAAYNPARCAGQTAAFASSCAQETSLDRPVVGYVNLCPESLNLTTSSYTFLQGTVRHEIYHILAFSPGLYAYYRDSTGGPRTRRLTGSNLPALGFITTTAIPGLTFPSSTNYQWASTTVQQVALSGWVAGTTTTTLPTYYMVTPKVREFARSHFACADLEGAMLENQGGSGTALTHWEKRTFENEVMTGTFTQDYSYSALTLSLMEDTGWYGVNYSSAETLVWGLNAGCGFVRQSCGSWMTARNSTGGVQPFCLNLPTETRRFFCNVDHSARSVCNIAQYSTSLPQEYRYMTPALLPGVNPALLAQYGGGTQLTDYCPYYTSFKLSGTQQRSECYNSANTPAANVGLEYYGSGSRCILHTTEPWVFRTATTRVTAQFGSGCYRTVCSAPASITVQVGSKTVNCTSRAGTEVSVGQTTSDGTTYTAAIICPAYSQACPTISAAGLPIPIPNSNPPPAATTRNPAVTTTDSGGVTVPAGSILSLSLLALLTLLLA